jgi:UDP-N-acetylglucosamine 4,6-dehydratase/5-epimerase
MKTMTQSKISKELSGKTILITGGAGSIGSAIVKQLLKYPVKTIRILDIDEHALFKLGRQISDSRLRFLLGSILDKDRIDLAGNSADIIIHTAAIKNIEISEYNPIETIDANINGTVNLIKMAINNKPKKFINISTDKAAEPSTLYGTTKLLGERLISWSSTHVPSTKFTTIRFGNVFETRGNAFEIWDEESKNKKPLTITDLNMKRYFFHVDEAANFILDCLPHVKHGEIFVPKLNSYKISELASKYSTEFNIVGIRKGEKMQEILLTEREKLFAKEKKSMWIIPPNN